MKYRTVRLTIPIGPYPMQFINQNIDRLFGEESFDFQVTSWKFATGKTTYNQFHCLPVGVEILVNLVLWETENQFKREIVGEL